LKNRVLKYSGTEVGL